MTTTRDHSNETAPSIWDRKEEDIRNVDQTFWYYTPVQDVSSPKRSTPDVIQGFAQTRAAAKQETWCLFFVPMGSSNDEDDGGAVLTASTWTDTLTRTTPWLAMPSKNGITLGPVTWRRSSMPCALVFDYMERVDPTQKFDLSVFSRLAGAGGGPVVPFIQGKPTLLAERNKAGKRNKPAERSLVLIGRLASPYAVWLRA